MRSHQLILTLLASLLTLALGLSAPINSPPAKLLKQAADGFAASEMTQTELAELGDPFFNLVLKTNAGVTRLSEIERLLQPNPSAKPRVFVVSEHLASSTDPPARRAVISFSGTNGTEQLRGNVMLSISFNSVAWSDEPSFIEVWGWDNKRGRYNYYRLDTSGTEDSRMSWKFRGSSVDADLLMVEQRRHTCMECHINGAPVMKELFRPWNNWHGEEFKASYLIDDPGNTGVWPMASDARFKERLDLAERLEVDLIMPAIRRFNTRRINQTIKRRPNSETRVVNSNGTNTVLQGRRLLKPLFQTTEFNIASSVDKSGVHPFATASTFNPNTNLRLPNSFFLNVDLIAGGGSPGFNGLKIAEARAFAAITIKRGENRELLEELQVKLNGVVPGDTNFAWLVPEPSMIDNDIADQLLKQGIVTAHFLAAVLAVDLETPVVSENRASLLQFVPEKFDFKPFTGTNPATAPRRPATDFLTKATINALESAAPAPGTAAADFLSLLKSPNAVTVLRARVKQYETRVKARLANVAERKDELRRLFSRAIATRRAVLNDPVLRALDESGGKLLFALP